MSRLPRLCLPGYPLHMIQRGVNRQRIFVSPWDRYLFLAILDEASRKHELQIHSFVLMDNHIHLLATPSRADSASKTMQSVGRSYVHHFNSQYKRTGTLWEGRFKSTLVDSNAYFMMCSRYIELNPVRAGIVSQPGDHRWSSYRHNADGMAEPLITEHALYSDLGGSNRARQMSYRALFQTQPDLVSYDEIRESTNKGWPLGDSEFRQRVETTAVRRCAPLPRGRQKNHGKARQSGSQLSSEYRRRLIDSDPN